AREDDLVVLRRVAAEKDQLDRAQPPAIRFGQTEHACVKIGHPREVGHVQPHVAEGKPRHRRGTHMKLATFSTAKGASYGAVVDKGIVDLGKRLGNRYPDLKALVEANA